MRPHEHNNPATQPPRPGSVTWAGFVLLAIGVIVLVSLFDTIGTVRSVENQEVVEKFLKSPMGSGLGLSVERVLVVQRYLALVCGAAAAAATVLGGWLLRGPDKSIRLALTSLALPLFISGWALNIFGVTMMGAAIILLWIQPSRDWFNGVVREPPTTAAPAPTPVWPPPPGMVPGASHRPKVTNAENRAHRPEAVLLAAVITWMISALLLLVGLGLLAVVMQSPDTLLAEFHRQEGQLPGVTEQALLGSAYFLAAVLVVFSVAAMVMAAVMLRRHRWAAHVLTVLSVLLLAACLIGSVTAPFMLGPGLCALAITALIRRRDVRSWYDG